jgi:hypothetical protein
VVRAEAAPTNIAIVAMCEYSKLYSTLRALWSVGKAHSTGAANWIHDFLKRFHRHNS